MIDKEDLCLQNGCVKCCLNTEMMLSNSDIKRIERLGFTDFVVAKGNGVRQLKNLMRRCVFHNGQRCTIYRYRPEGCRLYPAIFDLDKSKTVLDRHCPHHREFRLTPQVSRKIIRLLRKLSAERKSRTDCTCGGRRKKNEPVLSRVARAP